MPRTDAPDLSTDRQWLEGYRGCNRAADEKIFRSYVGFVTTIFSQGVTLKDGRRLPAVPFDLQQDLVHETFMRAFRPSARIAYDGLRPFAPYIGQIARNILVDYYRASTARKRSANFVVDVDVSVFADDAPLPDRVALQEEEREIVRGFLATLSENERTFVKVRFEEARSQSDTASLLDITRHRVRTLDLKIQHALKAFLDQFKGES